VPTLIMILSEEGKKRSRIGGRETIVLDLQSLDISKPHKRLDKAYKCLCQEACQPGGRLRRYSPHPINKLAKRHSFFLTEKCGSTPHNTVLQ